VVGLLDASERKVTPLLFPNGRPVSTLQLLIEDWDTVGERLLPARPEEEVASVEVLAPLRGRDVLCVGKNYKEHAE
jgi:2-keto-4-pentenoate hydratase/2-oxohepta-3-ene-1,7-dioic acid hydratase in catechol pathway